MNLAGGFPLSVNAENLSTRSGNVANAKPVCRMGKMQKQFPGIAIYMLFIWLCVNEPQVKISFGTRTRQLKFIYQIFTPTKIICHLIDEIYRFFYRFGEI